MRLRRRGGGRLLHWLSDGVFEHSGNSVLNRVRQRIDGDRLG